MSTKRNPIIQQLKRFSSIEPDPIFVARLRSALVDVSHSQVAQRRSFLRWPTFAFVGSGVLAALLIVGITQFSEPATVRASSLDTTALTQEFDELTLNIRLKEIDYQTEVSEVISEAVEEIVNTQTSHLNPSLIDAEQNIFLFDEPTDTQIDDLLEKLTR